MYVPVRRFRDMKEMDRRGLVCVHPFQTFGQTFEMLFPRCTRGEGKRIRWLSTVPEDPNTQKHIYMPIYLRRRSVAPATLNRRHESEKMRENPSLHSNVCLFPGRTVRCAGTNLAKLTTNHTHTVIKTLPSQGRFPRRHASPGRICTYICGH